MKNLKMVLFKILGVAGILLLLWFVVPAIITAYFHVGIYTGAGISILMIIIGFFPEKTAGFFSAIWHVLIGKIALIAVALIVTVILGFALACMISIGSGQERGADKGSTIIVLGCTVYEYGPSRMLISRLDCAYDFLTDDPDSVCIVCGGQGEGEPVTEASAMFDYLVEKGIDSSRIYLEDKSTDTVENLNNAMQIIKDNSLNETCTIVTNDFHTYRALKYAEKAGYKNVGSISAPTLWWLFPSLYIREMYGIMELWIINS